MRVDPKRFAGRTILRAGYALARVYWFLARPETEGAKIILSRGGRVLFVQHTYVRGWSFPGGGMRRGESPKDAVVRETLEELGVSPQNVRRLGTFTTDVEYKKDTIHMFSGELEHEHVYPDRFEIEEAKWFPAGDPPELSPLARRMYGFLNPV